MVPSRPRWLLLAVVAALLLCSWAPAAVHAAAELVPTNATTAAAADPHAGDHHAGEAAHVEPAAAKAAEAAAPSSFTSAAAAAADDPHAADTHAGEAHAADAHAGEAHAEYALEGEAHTAEEHAAEVAAAGTEAGDSHAGHSHGVSLNSYCEALANGEDPCAAAELTDYNLGLHIGSIFILLGVSMAGSLLPVLLHISSRSSAVLAGVKMGTYFGFGTILSTAFIHMLLPAQANLSSPCLSSSWNNAYEAWAYLFVTLAIVFMQLIDYLIESQYQRFLERRGGRQPHGAACAEQAGCGDEHTHHAAVVGAIASMHTSQAHLPLGPPCTHGHDHGSTDGSSHGHKNHGHAHSHCDAEKGVVAAREESTEAGSDDGAPCEVHGEGCKSLMPHASHKADASQVVGIYMMEAGIIFHSVLIGITLGVTAGDAFNTLLVALSFHQFFEGFAIGSAVVDSGLGVMKSCMMGLAYSITTPLGIAIGIGVRESFNSNSQTTLLVEGVFDSISTGILIYVVLVELINPLMTQSAWLRSRRWWVQVLAFTSFYAGVAVMAVIGKWV